MDAAMVVEDEEKVEDAYTAKTKQPRHEIRPRSWSGLGPPLG
jgi:hypothetical protein